MSKKNIIENSFYSQFSEKITFQWVKTHNLKNIDIEIPKNKIIAITGVSGSGKSSLAFDTIYKEWQFRYIESLSSYLRQFFNLGERPEIDHCTGLSPAIAIEQNKRTWNSRSSVGTLTEIDDYLRLLFAKLWKPYCYNCKQEIKPQNNEQIIEEIQKDFADKKIYLLQESGSLKSKTELAEFVKKNRNRVEKGRWFTRYLIVNKEQIQKNISQTIANSLKLQKKEKIENPTKILDPIEYFYLETPNVPDEYFPLNIYGIYDRVTIEDIKIPRIKEDIIKILNESKKFGIFCAECPEQTIKRYTDKMYCANCNITYPEFTTQHFSSNRQEWACENCLGLGEILQVDMEKILDPNSSYSKAILPRRDSNLWQWVLKKLAQKYEINPERTRKDLPERFQHVVLFGDDELLRLQYSGRFMSIRYKGIEEIIKDQYSKWLLTVDFQAMLDMKTCPECNWDKLKKESLNVFINIKQTKKSDSFINYNIANLQKLPLKELIEILINYKKNADQDQNLLERITNPLIDRCETILELGLGYIGLNRWIDTLSGWEIQRLRLAKQLGNKLTGIIYVLDEPTIWLDIREIKKAILSIQKLKEMWNTIIVVEHNEEFIKAADRVIEIGPGAGDFGGKLLFNWDYDEFIKGDTLTAQYISWKKNINVEFEHNPSNHKIHIRKASKHNLKKVDVDINLWAFTIITGPSGAGKTTLMYDTLFKFFEEKEKFVQWYIRLQLLKKWRNRQDIASAAIMHKEEFEHFQNLALQEFYKNLGVDTITGHEEVKNVIYVDQSSIGKTPRSCPATFVWTFDHIRQLYANTSESKYLWFNASYFSFNSKKGTCTACKGYWYKKIELQFLPDTYVACDLCKGKRYKNEVLEIKRKWKDISEVLGMYVDEALDFFKEIDNIKEDLLLMKDIGLWYLKMWQPAHTLSGWESQRIKLVKHLLKSYRWHSIYFLDEPTVGLHMEDIEKLLKVIREFLNKWDTILMIEHDKNILKYADHIVYLDEWKMVKTLDNTTQKP